MAEPHTLEYTELTTRIQTMNKAIYYIIRITTGGSVRARKLTPMHIHRQHEMEPLLEALGLSTKQRQPSESYREQRQRTMTEAQFLVQQHFVLDKTRYHTIPFPLLL